MSSAHPLTRLRAMSEVALASPDASDRLTTSSTRARAGLRKKLEQLIDGLLALTRGQAGLERRERVDLASLTSHAILAHHPQLPTSTSTYADARLSATQGDPRLLERLITNLIDNAIRHNVAGGRVEITTGTRDAVRSYRSRTRARRSHPTRSGVCSSPSNSAERTGHNTGHGLGLSIVRAIVTAHQATLRAHLAPGGGLAIEIAFSSASDTRPKTASITHPSKATPGPPSQDNRAGRDPRASVAGHDARSSHGRTVIRRRRLPAPAPQRQIRRESDPPLTHRCDLPTSAGSAPTRRRVIR